jgi:hypothetical protein
MTFGTSSDEKCNRRSRKSRAIFDHLRVALPRTPTFDSTIETSGSRSTIDNTFSLTISMPQKYLLLKTEKTKIDDTWFSHGDSIFAICVKGQASSAKS